jgi:hypothetical protein
MMLVTIALLAAGTAEARRPAVAATVAAFQKVDTNQNRQISATEWTDAGRNADVFVAIDRNNNGQVSPMELLRALIARFLGNRD